MNYITIPPLAGNKMRRLSFYLAAEEFIARYTNIEDAFFMWQTHPTVIFGRNQVVENEVNLDYCHQNGIEFYRRKSGGGCVYSDEHNIMFSHIATGENVTFTFSTYIESIASMLRKLGVEAEASKRNDILIGNQKVSGNAFYHIPHRNIVHGTMLYDTNLAHMVGSITPNNEKLVSKGVESVRQRICLLKDYINLNIEEFKQFVKKELCSDETVLTPEDIVRIEEIEQEYLDSHFIFGNNPAYTKTINKRFEGIGSFEVRLQLKNNRIKHINLLGDYFLYGDLDNEVLSHLMDVDYSPDAVQQALCGIDLGNYIYHFTTAHFIELLFN